MERDWNESRFLSVIKLHGCVRVKYHGRVWKIARYRASTLTAQKFHSIQLRRVNYTSCSNSKKHSVAFVLMYTHGFDQFHPHQDTNSFFYYFFSMTSSVGGSNLLTVFFSFLLQSTMNLTKRIDEVRLLESRKSARLADQDTDFARLADMAGDRKRTSTHNIDVPHING